MADWNRDAVAREIVESFRRRMQTTINRWVDREGTRKRRYMSMQARTLRELAKKAKARREETRRLVLMKCSKLE